MARTLEQERAAIEKDVRKLEERRQRLEEKEREAAIQAIEKSDSPDWIDRPVARQRSADDASTSGSVSAQPVGEGEQGGVDSHFLAPCP